MNINEERLKMFNLYGRKDLKFNEIEEKQTFKNLEALADFNIGDNNSNFYNLVNYAKNGLLNIITLKSVYHTQVLQTIFVIKSLDDYNLILSHYIRRIKEKIFIIFNNIIKYVNSNKLNYKMFNAIRKAKQEIIYNCYKFHVKYNDDLNLFEKELITRI